MNNAIRVAIILLAAVLAVNVYPAELSAEWSDGSKSAEYKLWVTYSAYASLVGHSIPEAQKVLSEWSSGYQELGECDDYSVECKDSRIISSLSPGTKLVLQFSSRVGAQGRRITDSLKVSIAAEEGWKQFALKDSLAARVFSLDGCKTHVLNKGTVSGVSVSYAKTFIREFASPLYVFYVTVRMTRGETGGEVMNAIFACVTPLTPNDLPSQINALENGSLGLTKHLPSLDRLYLLESGKPSDFWFVGGSGNIEIGL